MSTTASQISRTRRQSTGSTSTVYVQVPTSPFDLEHYHPLPTTTATTNKVTSTHVSTISAKLKENTPLQPPARLSSNTVKTMPSSASATGPTSVKRKLADRDRDGLVDSTPSSSKRVRSLSSASITGGMAPEPLQPTQLNSPTMAVENTIEVDASKACPEFPNGWTYCHQCCKKRDLGDIIHCTVIEEREVGKNKTIKQKRCVNKFCRPCLKNRYDEDLTVLKTNKKREPGMVDNAGYIFKCPKCRDVCNCPRCRKLKGLEPIGAMAVRKPLPKEPSVKKDKAKVAKADVNGEIVLSESQDKKRGRPKVQKKPKNLAPVKWTRIASALSHAELEERLYIREFVLRFHHLSETSMPKAQLDELEQLNGNGKSVHGVDKLDQISWVGEACVKSIIMALLGLSAKATGENDRTARASQAALKTLRPAGLHLSKVWSVLAEWQSAVNAGVASTSKSRPPTPRDDISTTSSLTTLSETENMEQSDSSTIFLAEPRALSLAMLAAVEQGRRATRGMTNATTTPNGTSVTILSSSQMIPVIISMIEHALQLDLYALREDLDEGLKTSKELVRKVRECVKGEGERWEVIRKERERMKDKDKVKDKERFQFARKLHKDILSALDHSSLIVQSEFLLRFAPLGTDPDGRTYYALSPGHAEREAALEYIDVMHTIREQNGNSKLRLKKKGRVVKPEERDELTEFSWMILVWGRIPDEKEAFCPNIPGKDNDNDDSDTMNVDGAPKDGDSPEERWYAFTQPQDIRHLADWVAAENGLDEEGADKSSDNDQDGPIKRLITSLKDFAELLEWRSLDDKYRLPSEEYLPANASTNGVSEKISAKTEKISTKTKAIPPERFYGE